MCFKNEAASTRGGYSLGNANVRATHELGLQLCASAEEISPPR